MLKYFIRYECHDNYSVGGNPYQLSLVLAIYHNAMPNFLLNTPTLVLNGIKLVLRDFSMQFSMICPLLRLEERWNSFALHSAKILFGQIDLGDWSNLSSNTSCSYQEVLQFGPIRFNSFNWYLCIIAYSSNTSLIFNCWYLIFPN